MNLADFRIHSTKKLDRILVKCCSLVMDKHAEDPEYWGMVGACVLGTDGKIAYGVNHKVSGGRDHAEVVALKNYIRKYGRDGVDGCIIITTLSPCSQPIDQPGDRNCVDYIQDHGIKKVYCGCSDPTQDDTEIYRHKRFHTMETRNQKLQELCKKMASTFLGKI